MIIDFPEIRQTYNYDCGANALVSLLVYSGIEEREDRIMKLAGTSSEGTSIDGILKVLQYYGLNYRIFQPMLLEALRFNLAAGYPVLIALQAYRESDEPYANLWTDGHWVVAIGYEGNKIIFEDPSAFCRTWLSEQELLCRWHDDGIQQWGCIIKAEGLYKQGAMRHMD